MSYVNWIFMFLYRATLFVVDLSKCLCSIGHRYVCVLDISERCEHSKILSVLVPIVFSGAGT